MNTQTIYLHHSWKFHYGEEPDAWKKTMILAGQHRASMTGLLAISRSLQRGYAAGGIGWYRGFSCLPSIVENASCCCLTVSTKKARSGSTVITAFIPMDLPFSEAITSRLFGTDGINEIGVRVDRTEFQFPMVYSSRIKGNALLVADLLHVTIWHLLSMETDKISWIFSSEICNEDQSIFSWSNTLIRKHIFRRRAVLFFLETAKLKTEGTVAQPTLWSRNIIFIHSTWLTKPRLLLLRTSSCGIRTFRLMPIMDYG